MSDPRVHNPRLAQLLSQLDANNVSLAKKTQELKEQLDLHEQRLRLDLVPLPESYLRRKSKP